MPSRSEITYFGAGPALLPTAVLEQASQALLNYDSTGLGLAEHSHRSSIANKVLADTKAHLTTLLDIPNDYEILFMQGGGSGQFSAVVYNLVSAWVARRHEKAEQEIPNGEGREHLMVERLKKEVTEQLKLDYLVTGSWSLKASQEAARLIGPEHVNVAVDAREGKDGKFVVIPVEEKWKLTPTRKEGGTGSAFVYYCDNETVDGVEFPTFPKALESRGGPEDEERLVVADMSSNILSRRVDVKKFAVIFVCTSAPSRTTQTTDFHLQLRLEPRRMLEPPGLPLSSCGNLSSHHTQPLQARHCYVLSIYPLDLWSLITPPSPRIIHFTTRFPSLMCGLPGKS